MENTLYYERQLAYLNFQLTLPNLSEEEVEDIEMEIQQLEEERQDAWFSNFLRNLKEDNE